MNYEKRSELRKECSKFIRFSYLVDFIAMEALCSIYKLSVNDLITKLDEHVNVEPYVVYDKNTARPQALEPLFMVKVEDKFEEIA